MYNIEEIEEQYGTRPRIPAGHGEPLVRSHWRGELPNGDKFLYCPVGFICSWHPGDYDNWWCHWCKEYLAHE